MSDRSAGYVTDVGYTFGYHAALDPRRTRLAFLRAGLEPPRVETACELGFGQGVSLAVHAAASRARWWGNDLLPEHVRFAQSLDDASGAGTTLAEATFEEFARLTDLPRFDFIGLHGVLSWISAENRERIAAFVRDHLAPGGVVYTGYNALPGWADMVPLRRLMVEHAARAASGGTVERIEAALAFTERLLDTHPLALRATPRVVERFERLRHADRRYLAHEYFNRDWHPLYFTEAADLFATAGLRHACSAQLREQIDALNLTGEQRRTLAAIDDPRLRETVRDFVTNPQFRRDYWVREARPLSVEACAAAWRDTRVVLVSAPEDIPDKVSGMLGEVRLSDASHRTVIDALRDHVPRTIGEVHAAAGAFPIGDIADAVFALAAFDHIAIAQDDTTIERCAPRTSRLNALLVERARASDDIDVLASPVTGGGVAVARIEQVFLAAIAAGRASPDDLARFAREALADRDADASAPARRFVAQRLPVLRALRVTASNRID